MSKTKNMDGSNFFGNERDLLGETLVKDFFDKGEGIVLSCHYDDFLKIVEENNPYKEINKTFRLGFGIDCKKHTQVEMERMFGIKNLSYKLSKAAEAITKNPKAQKKLKEMVYSLESVAEKAALFESVDDEISGYKKQIEVLGKQLEEQSQTIERLSKESRETETQKLNERIQLLEEKLKLEKEKTSILNEEYSHVNGGLVGYFEILFDHLRDEGISGLKAVTNSNRKRLAKRLNDPSLIDQKQEEAI